MKAKRGWNSRHFLQDGLLGLLLVMLLLILAESVSTWRLDRWQSELLVMVGLTLVALAALPWES